MEYIDFCDSRLSRIVLGTYGFSEKVDSKTAFDIMDYYLESGGNIIDTARGYADGEAEEIVGRYLKEKNQKIFISTKCALPKEDGVSRLSPVEIEEDIDASLKALKTDTIDLLWLHRDDVKRGVDGIIDTLNSMVQKGKIRFFGASNWTYDRIESANRYAYESGQDGFCASQVHYNLATSTGTWGDGLVLLSEEEKKLYERDEFPLFAYSPQAKGFFEKYSKGILSRKAKERYLCEESVKAYMKIKKEAETRGETISHTAVQMLFESLSCDSFAIVGASSVGQLKDTL